MRFIQKFENKKGMKDYEKEFIDSKIKYIHNKKKRFKVMFEGNEKSFGFKKYNGDYNAKLKAVEYLNQLQKQYEEEIKNKNYNDVWCPCGSFVKHFRKKQHDKSIHHKKYISEKCDKCENYSDTSYVNGTQFCWQCSPDWEYI